MGSKDARLPGLQSQTIKGHLLGCTHMSGFSDIITSESDIFLEKLPSGRYWHSGVRQRVNTKMASREKRKKRKI